MAIRVELTPEDESRLTRRARALGVAPEEHALDLLREAILGRPVLGGRAHEPDEVLDSIGTAETVTADQMPGPVLGGTPQKDARPKWEIIADPATGLPVLSAGPETPLLTSKDVEELLTNFP